MQTAPPYSGTVSGNGRTTTGASSERRVVVTLYVGFRVYWCDFRIRCSADAERKVKNE